MAHLEDDKLIILDKKYIQIPNKESKSILHKLYPFMMMAAQMALLLPFDMYGNPTKKPKERPRVDLIKEYELILQKKSKLSRSNREWVVSQFNKHFVEVK